MKVIFLDIDGVLNHPPLRPKTVDPRLVDRINRICCATGALIVVSSTWRKGMTLEQISREVGIPLFRFVGKTPVMFSPDGQSVRRGTEIDAWLQSFKGEFGSGAIDTFVILDDDPDMEPHMDRLVRTDWRVGITDQNEDEVINRLCGDGWSRVVLAAECVRDDAGRVVCPWCGLEYVLACRHPGPTEDGVEYQMRDGLMWGRRLPVPDSATGA